MTEKEIKKLNRRELIEILLYLRKELDETKAENDRLKMLADERNGDFEKLTKSVDKMSGQLNRLLRLHTGENPDSEIQSGAESKKTNNRRKKRRAQSGGKQENTTAWSGYFTERT